MVWVFFMRAFVFSLEAFLALLAALAFLAVFSQPFYVPRYSDVYAYQLAQDFAEISLRNYEEELAAFSQGDAMASLRLKSLYEKMLNAVGTYCLILEANGHSLEAGCGSPNAESFPAHRIFWDGEKFVEAQFILRR